MPEWVGALVDWDHAYETDVAKMKLAVSLSAHNVEQGTGGPFGAVVFRTDTNRVVAAGVNGVARERNSVMHAEVLALMLAEQAVGAYSLQGEGRPAHELVTSCDPCAMCLGAILWSGVTRVVCGASREDANRIGFDEGPVFPESYRYLETRGIMVVHGVLRAEAGAVLDAYGTGGGLIYNG